MQDVKICKMIEHKYTEKNHPPVPLLKVGDICYARAQWGIGSNYSDYSKCQVRKVCVVWNEPTYGEKTGHWSVSYKLYTDVDDPYLRSARQHNYHLGEDGFRKDIYLTPQEVMEKNVADFMKTVKNTAGEIRKTMLSLGYSEEKIKGLLE